MVCFPHNLQVLKSVVVSVPIPVVNDESFRAVGDFAIDLDPSFPGRVFFHRAMLEAVAVRTPLGVVVSVPISSLAARNGDTTNNAGLRFEPLHGETLCLE